MWNQLKYYLQKYFLNVSKLLKKLNLINRKRAFKSNKLVLKKYFTFLLAWALWEFDTLFKSFVYD